MKKGEPRLNYHVWTDSDVARLAALCALNLSTKEIAASFGVPISTIACKRRKLKLPSPKLPKTGGKKREWTDAQLSDELAHDRFIQKVSFDDDGCWRWAGSISGTGYGYFSFCSQTVYAHRIGYEFFVERIPDGLFLDHLCRNRACVNPDHLEPVTQRVNVLRGNLPDLNRARRKWAA